MKLNALRCLRAAAITRSAARLQPQALGDSLDVPGAAQAPHQMLRSKLEPVARRAGGDAGWRGIVGPGVCCARAAASRTTDQRIEGRYTR